MMLRRSIALWTEPHNAVPALARMAAEKQRAFTEGAFAAGRAVARGEVPSAVVAAALRPARRRVRRNLNGEGLA